MMLIDNIEYLRKTNKVIREQLKQYDNETMDEYRLLQTKNNEYTIEVKTNKGIRFLHSKYNPAREAQMFVKQFQDEVDENTHVIFYGVGLGYHVKEFLNIYNIHSYSLYEPIPYLFYQFLSLDKLENIASFQPEQIFLETDFQVTMKEVEQFLNSFNRRILIVTLPSYEQ